MTDTPMSAEEREHEIAALLGSTPWERQPGVIAKHIGQAEAAARKAGQQEGYELGYEKAVMSEAAQAVGRKAALEEAAQIFDAMNNSHIATAIRALSEKPQ